MGEEYIYLDESNEEDKVIISLARLHLKETLYGGYCLTPLAFSYEKDVDILDIYKYKGSFIMELNVFVKGKYYLVSKSIDNDWLTPKLRELKLSHLLN